MGNYHVWFREGRGHAFPLDLKITVRLSRFIVLFIYSDTMIFKISEGTVLDDVLADLKKIDKQLGVNVYFKNIGIKF